MIRLESPYALLLILLVPVVVWWSMRSRARPSIRFSSSALLEPVPVTFRQRAGVLVAFLRFFGLAALVIALARPQTGLGEVRTTARGVAIMMVVDRSGSMGLPLDYGGAPLTRLEVVKRVFREFVAGNARDLKGRPEDLIGLVTFSRFPETVCPLVSVHDTLLSLMDAVQLATTRGEDGTAIGDGMALAAARLQNAEKELGERNRGEAQPAFTIKSKALILLTDGDENVADQMNASQAADLCAQWGIKVYAIGIGDEEGGLLRTPTGNIRIPRGGGFNERLMKSIAQKTGGRYWRAADGEALRRVYASIDELEKTEIISTEFTTYREEFVPWAIAGAVALALQMLLSATVLRRAP